MSQQSHKHEVIDECVICLCVCMQVQLKRTLFLKKVAAPYMQIRVCQYLVQPPNMIHLLARVKL